MAESVPSSLHEEQLKAKEDAIALARGELESARASIQTLRKAAEQRDAD